MKAILIWAVSVLGFVGAASAQQAPFLIGNYSADVLNEYNGYSDEAPMTGARGVTRRDDIGATTGGSYNIDAGNVAVAQPELAWKPCLDIVSAQSCGSIRSGR